MAYGHNTADWEIIGLGVKKQIQTAGIGDNRPKDCSECLIIFKRISIPDNLDFPYPKDEKVEVRIGFESFDIDFYINKCLQSMKLHEQSHFEIELKMQEKLESESIKCILEICLLEFNAVPEIWEMTGEEKLKLAQLHKNRGDEFYKLNNITKALNQYANAMKYLITFGPEPWPEDEADEIRRMKEKCYSNIAACQLKINAYKYVVENSTKALDLNPLNFKCLYRRAAAYKKLNNYELSLKDLKALMEIQPSDQTAISLYKQIKGEILENNSLLAKILLNCLCNYFCK